MVAGISNASAIAADPHIRQIDPWRDGRAVANLLETSFHDEIIDDSGHRMIQSLRNYGVFDALAFGFGTGFVWMENGELIGNASVQRNATHRDIWIIGNVATHVAHRNRGIGRAIVEACIHYAIARGARRMALQADETNKPALHLYEKLGFERAGAVTHYLRSPVRVRPVETQTSPSAIRTARWSDRAQVWTLARRNLPELLTFAEPFDKRIYQLGFRWSLVNALNGNVEQWHVSDALQRGCLIGAVRTRVNFEGSNHHLELMLSDEAGISEGVALIERALQRFEKYISRPIYAAQSRPHGASHAAFQEMNFQPTRTLVHMNLEIRG
jgi:ribosomal protein S18 acetylase RimI-like enzyme